MLLLHQMSASEGFYDWLSWAVDKQRILQDRWACCKFDQCCFIATVLIVRGSKAGLFAKGIELFGSRPVNRRLTDLSG